MYLHNNLVVVDYLRLWMFLSRILFSIYLMVMTGATMVRTSQFPVPSLYIYNNLPQSFPFPGSMRRNKQRRTKMKRSRKEACEETGKVMEGEGHQRRRHWRENKKKLEKKQQDGTKCMEQT